MRISTVVGVPIVLWLLLEFGFAALGFGYPAKLLVPCEVNGKPHLCDNVKFTWRFFHPYVARDPSVIVFPKDKPKDTFRIFVLGESAAKGTPDDAFSVGRILDVMLKERYPNVHFEVITAAAAAINSHVIRLTADECADHAPDLFVVYMGNNEVVGPYGAGTVFAPISKRLGFIKFGIAFKGTKIGQLMSSAWAGLGTGKALPTMWRGMSMFVDMQVRHDAPELELVYGHFQENLNDIIESGLNAGAKVVLSTVASNTKDNAPFSSLHQSGITDDEKQKWEALYQEGISLAAQGDNQAAMVRFSKAAVIDDNFADLHFRIADCLWTMGDFAKARSAYLKAKEQDTLRFRADDRINQIIRTAAKAKGDNVLLADAAQAFENSSPHGVPGESLFLEHVHFNFDGAYLLARTLLEQVEKTLPNWIQAKRIPGETIPSVATCATRLAFTNWDRYRTTRDAASSIIERPPFTNQLNHQEQMERLRQTIASLKANLTEAALGESDRQYRQAILQSRHDWMLKFKHGTLAAEAFSDLRTAEAAFRDVQKAIPHAWIVYNALGTVLQAKGDVSGAATEFEHALDIKPTSWETLFLAADVYRQQGETDKAWAGFSKVIELMPEAVAAYQKLSAILEEQGEMTEAEDMLRRGLKIVPNSFVLHGELGNLFSRMRKWDKAIAAYKMALTFSPESNALKAALQKAEGHSF